MINLCLISGFYVTVQLLRKGEKHYRAEFQHTTDANYFSDIWICLSSFN